MIFTTMSQAAVLLLALVLGWFLGMLSAPRGLKWKKRYEEERDAHAAYRTDADTRLRDSSALTTNRDAYVRDLEAKNQALVAENEALKARPAS
ncbi:MAG: hypothetical protein V4459_11525 [Pseudomonadota bacterium]